MSVERSSRRSSRVRLEDVALAAGVSKSAASYALSGNGRVGAETVERVREAAKMLGYRAHRPAQEMSSGQTRTVGAILSPTRHEGETPNYYVAELLAGVEDEARSRGLAVRVTMWAGEIPAIAVDGSVDGLLYLGGAFDPRLLDRGGAPTVLVGTSFSQVGCDAVLADNRRGGYLATSHLLAAGCRQLALLNGPGSAPTSDGKWLGFRDALQDWGLPPDAFPVSHGEFSPEAGYEMARAALAAARGIDGIVAGDDPIAIGALHAAQDLGIAVPEELRITGYGDSPTGRMLRPQLSSIRVFQREMGRLGVRRLLDRLHGGVGGSVRILVGPELVVRESSGK
jgi:DNA-binding LacI/PurR family transcriptional regulator